MKRLIFIRHAETDLAGTFCGHTDPPLSAGGIQQLQGLKLSLAGEQIDSIVTSDLLRTQQSAEALAESRGIPLTLEKDLREIYFGRWEGMTWSEIEAHFPAPSRHWLEHFPKEAAPGGESYDSFRLRVQAALDRILSNNDSNVAIVTHAGVLRVALQHLMGYSFEMAQAQKIGFGTFFIYAARGVIE